MIYIFFSSQKKGGKYGRGLIFSSLVNLDAKRLRKRMVVGGRRKEEDEDDSKFCIFCIFMGFWNFGGFLCLNYGGRRNRGRRKKMMEDEGL